jgi:hypothetical protein
MQGFRELGVAEMRLVVGGSFWGKLWRGIKKVVHAITKPIVWVPIGLGAIFGAILGSRGS